MLIAKVTGMLVATQKTASMTGQRLLIVDPMTLDDLEQSMEPSGRALVAVDTVGAGVGSIVVVTQGSSARLTPETKSLPVDAVVIGMVDSVRVGDKAVFEKDTQAAEKKTPVKKTAKKKSTKRPDR